jgi:hypothetical protein
MWNPLIHSTYPVNMHEKPWDIILQQNEEINLVYTRRQERNMMTRGKKRGRDKGKS